MNGVGCVQSVTVFRGTCWSKIWVNRVIYCNNIHVVYPPHNQKCLEWTREHRKRPWGRHLCGNRPLSCCSLFVSGDLKSFVYARLTSFSLWGLPCILKKTKLFNSPETKWLPRGKGLFLKLLVVMYTGWDEIFSGVYCSDVEKIVSSLSRNKGSGLDKIPTRVIKDFVPVIIIIPSIAAIINSSFTTSTCILKKCHQSWKRVILKNQGTIGQFLCCLSYLKCAKRWLLRVSEHPIPKNKQTSGGGTEQKKSGTPLKLLLSSLVLYLRWLTRES